MKKLNLLFTVVLGAAVLMGSTGCHRKPSLTPIPGMEGPSGTPSSGGLSSGVGIPADNGPTSVTRGPGDTIPMSDSDGKYGPAFAGTEDREKFKNDSVYFDFDKSTIKSSEESKLQDVAAYFKGNASDALVVEGNCDERGTEKYNLSLGERRALSVREYLVNLGMDPARIHTVTFGSSKPVALGHNEESYSKNRRGDMVLMHAK